MGSLPFEGRSPQPSVWGYNLSADSISHHHSITNQSSPGRSNGYISDNPKSSSPTLQSSYTNDQYTNMPAALLSSLKREKKPFTYTPGGVDLSGVLNARLQKRIEKKKKLSTKTEQAILAERPNSSNDLPIFEPPKQVLVMSTYNSPLDMYSVENALEALEVQAELTVNDKSLSSPSRSMTLPRNHKFQETCFEPKNVTQSKAFRVLQIITDTEEELSHAGNPAIKTNDVSPKQPQMTIPQASQNLQNCIANKQTQAHAYQHNSGGAFEQHRNSPILKRPADFLHNKNVVPLSFKPFQTPANITRKAINPIEGTDF